ncbi:MAG: Uma2 family endonuclease [Isosphaeraceae bacterium]
MATATLPQTEATLGQAPREHEDDELYEVVNGLRIEIPPMSAYAARVATRLATKLNQHAEPEKLGEAIVESLFRLPLTADKNRNRRPDVAFVSSERWPADRALPIAENAWDVVPDISIEVVSPHDLAEDLLDKIIEYFQAGVRLAWVIYPKQRLVHVYTGPRSIRVLTDADSLEGGPVLPGLSIPLMALFDPPPHQGA